MIALPPRTRAVADLALPTLAAALDAATAEPRLRAALAPDGELTLDAVRLVRLEPGRSAVLEYDVRRSTAAGDEALTVVARLRRRRSGRAALEQAEALWAAGFHAGSRDGVSVPEPLGRAPELQAWLQRKAPGTTFAALAGWRGGAALGLDVAHAADKLHRAPVVPSWTHGMADVLAGLDRRLGALAAERPVLAPRLVRLLDACGRAGAALGDAPDPAPIHGDLRGGHVLVDAGRLWLLDLEAHALGDPALDAGTLAAHLTEQALREHGDPDALAAVRRAFTEAFVLLSGEHRRRAVGVHADLALAGLVQRSGTVAGRAHLAEPLLELCEERFGLAPGRAR